MAELKTQPNEASVGDFVDSVEDEAKREDCRLLVRLMKRLSGETPTMWGDSIVGFGRYTYQTRDGKDHEWFKVGFSPRKQSLTLYLMTGFGQYDEYLSKLGKYSTGKSCLYIKRLGDVDLTVLEPMIGDSLKAIDDLAADD